MVTEARGGAHQVNGGLLVWILGEQDGRPQFLYRIDPGPISLLGMLRLCGCMVRMVADLRVLRERPGSPELAQHAPVPRASKSSVQLTLADLLTRAATFHATSTPGVDDRVPDFRAAQLATSEVATSHSVFITDQELESIALLLLRDSLKGAVASKFVMGSVEFVQVIEEFALKARSSPSPKSQA